MKTVPEVSIITPAFNCSKTIDETFGSILAQSFSNWEWIIVEDHSKDDSWEKLQSLKEKDKRIILLRTPQNSGAAAARNMAIEKARGRFIAFLDADDLWKPEKLTHQIAFMKKNKYCFSYSDYEVLYPDGRKKLYSPKRDWQDYKRLLKISEIGCLTVVYDAFCIGKRYMPLDCEKREDYGAWLDITKEGIIAHKIKESLATYRIVENSVSSRKSVMLKYHYRVYRNHLGLSCFGALKNTLVYSLRKAFAKY